MKKKYTYDQLGVSSEDDKGEIEHAVFKVIDSEYCGKALITKIFEKQGQIIVEFIMEGC